MWMDLSSIKIEFEIRMRGSWSKDVLIKLLEKTYRNILLMG